MAIVNINNMSKIRENYPNTWEWVRHKAAWEHITVGSVLNDYEEYINELMDKEEKEKIV